MRAESVIRWTRGHPARIGTVGGAAIALFVGVYDAVDTRNLLYLLLGVPFGLLFGLLVGLRAWVDFAIDSRRPRADLRHLALRERRTVMEAVRRGERVDDPNLARSVVEQADAIIGPQTRWDNSTPVVAAVFAVILLALGALDVSTGDISGAGGYGAFGVCVIASAIWLIVHRRRQIEGATKARELATRHLQAPSAPNNSSDATGSPMDYWFRWQNTQRRP